MDVRADCGSFSRAAEAAPSPHQGPGTTQ